MEYPKQTDNYNVDIFNSNFMQIANSSIDFEEKLSAEISRAKAAERLNASNIDAEKNRATSRENIIENRFAAESQVLRDLIDLAYANANGYTDDKISKLVNGAPSTLDTLKEIADALEDNADVVKALNDAIGTKAPQAELDLHVSDKAIHVTTSDKANWNTPTFTQAATRTNIESGEATPTLFGKIKKWFSDLKAVAFTGNYNDLSNKPTIPTVSNGTLTIQRNGSNVQTFAANQSTNATANITVPTKTSELTNDSGFVTAGSITTGVSGVKGNVESTYRAGNVNLTAANIGALSLAGGIMTGKLQIPSRAGSWIDGKTISNASIGITTQQNTVSYFPVMAGKTSSGHVWNLGGLGDDFGFYGFLKDRTENGTDWRFTINAGNGSVYSTGEITTSKLNVNTTGEAQVNVSRQGYSGRLVVSGGNKFGLYDVTHSKWVIYSENNGEIKMNDALHFYNEYVEDGVTYKNNANISNKGLEVVAWDNDSEETYTTLINSAGLNWLFNGTVSGSLLGSWLSGRNGYNAGLGTISRNGYGMSLTLSLDNYTSTPASGVFGPDSSMSAGKIDLGRSSLKFRNIYATNGTIQTSDRNEKNNIEELTLEKAQKLINGLKPSTYRMNSGNSGRTHWGVISQDIEELLEELSWTSLDFAGFIKSPKMTEAEYDEKTGKCIKESEIIEGEYDYSLRYDEFIAPIIKVIQAQHEEIEAQRKWIEGLEKRIEFLEGVKKSDVSRKV